MVGVDAPLEQHAELVWSTVLRVSYCVARGALRGSSAELRLREAERVLRARRTLLGDDRGRVFVQLDAELAVDDVAPGGAVLAPAVGGEMAGAQHVVDVALRTAGLRAVAPGAEAAAGANAAPRPPLARSVKTCTTPPDELP